MIDIKKAATPEGNGNHRHEDTNFFRWKEPPHQFTGTGPYKGFEFTRILRRDTGYIYSVDMGGANVLPRVQTARKSLFRHNQLPPARGVRQVGMVLSIAG